MNTITWGNSWHYRRSTSVASEDKLSSNNCVMTEIRRQAWPEVPIIKSSRCPRRWKEQSSSSNPQSDITSEEHLKILFRILSTKTFPITSLNHLHEYALYVFVETNCLSICTPTTRQNYRRPNFILQRAGFNPHLPTPFVLSDYQRYRVRGAQVHHYRTIALRRVVQRMTLDGRGRLVSSYS